MMRLNDTTREAVAAAIFDAHINAPGMTLTWEQMKRLEHLGATSPWDGDVKKRAYGAADAVIAAIQAELTAWQEDNAEVLNGGKYEASLTSGIRSWTSGVRFGIQAVEHVLHDGWSDR